MTNPRSRGKRAGNPWADFIRSVKDSLGWSVTELAEKTGISRQTIQRWLGGQLKTPSIENVKRVATATGVDPVEALRAAGHLVNDGEDSSENWEVRMIRESGLPLRVIDQLVRDTLERQERERDSRRAQLEQQIELLRSAAANTI